MDLLSIARILWRHKLLTLPVILLTMAASVGDYVAFSKPVYETNTHYALVLPPSGPYPADLAKDPGLANVSPANPYARFGDQLVVVQTLVNRVSVRSVRLALKAKGADVRYAVAAGIASGTIAVSGVGSTPQSAQQTDSLVGEQLQMSLLAMQKELGVNDYYLIRALEVDSTPARLRVSSLIRSQAAVALVGLFLLFGAVSVADALDKAKAERLARKLPSLEPSPLPNAQVPVSPPVPAYAEGPPMNWAQLEYGPIARGPLSRGPVANQGPDPDEGVPDETGRMSVRPPPPTTVEKNQPRHGYDEPVQPSTRNGIPKVRAGTDANGVRSSNGEEPANGISSNGISTNGIAPTNGIVSQPGVTPHRFTSLAAVGDAEDEGRGMSRRQKKVAAKPGITSPILGSDR